MLDGIDRSYTYLWDYLALWGLFAISFGLLRLVTDMVSRKRVVFDFWVETVGRSMLGRLDRLAVHRLHLRHDAHGSAGRRIRWDSSRLRSRGISWAWTPADIGWPSCRAVRAERSRGPNRIRPSCHPSEQDKDLNVRIFDPDSKFILKYYQRRVQFEAEPDYRVAR